MDVEKVLRLNSLTKEYKEFNLNLNPSDIVKLDETPDISESEKIMRKLHYKLKYNEDAIFELKNMIEGLKTEIKELKDKTKAQVQREFAQKEEFRPRVEQVQEKQEHLAIVDNRKNLTKPIDRNNVAPAEVAIENIFYCGQR